MSELKYWLGFNLVKGIGSAKVRALLDYFGSLELAWSANELQLQKIGFDKRAINTFLDMRPQLDLDVEMARIEQANVQLLTWDTAPYPTYLQEIPNPPYLLYMQGKLIAADQWAVAVVGTRRLTAYGRQMTKDLVAGLVRNNITVVSGLARGIDAIAHKTAIEMNGRTIGVLGSGLDCIYPSEHLGFSPNDH